MLINPGRYPAPLLHKQHIEVRREHTTVVLQIGSGVLKLPYGVAIELAQWLRVRGKQAKRTVQDTAHWSALALLDDLELPPLHADATPGQQRLHRRLLSWARSMFGLKRRGVSVGVNGQLVALQVGNTTVQMPYEAALQVSQWLRIHGRTAKRIAGDPSQTWGVLATLEAVRH